jgi:ankyrin repeat protein
MLTGRAQIEKLIIDRIPGVMIQQYDPDGERRKQLSPIARAAEMGDLQTVEDLLDLGVPASPDALYFAALEGHANVVEVLVDLMDDINTSVGWVGNALCAATVSIRPLESIKAAQTLLGRGADPKWQGGYYGNALQGATANNLREMVQLLVEYGADVNAQVGHYGNALTAAARHPLHFQEMASFFIRLGADIDAQGPGVYGNPLQTAIWMGHHDAIGFLLKHGASKTMSGRFGSAMDIAVNGRRFNDLLQERDEILALLEGD